MKRNNKKGFPLAELLIVVAIIAVLVAIAIPVFGAQLKKANEAVDQANIRACYAEAASDYLLDTMDTAAGAYNCGGITCTASVSGDQITVTVTGGAKSDTYGAGATYSNGTFTPAS